MLTKRKLKDMMTISSKDKVKAESDILEQRG